MTLFKNGRFTTYRTQDGLASNHIRAILCDRHGALWIATVGEGVSQYADGTFTTYTTADGLASNRALAIHEDDDGSLWFATRGRTGHDQQASDTD